MNLAFFSRPMVVLAALYFGAAPISAANTAPVIATTAQSPATVSASAPVWITTSATGQNAVTSVQLVYDAGAGSVFLPMLDDGTHQDVAAGDGIFGGQIPSFPTGTTVSYYIVATNNVGLSSTDPAIAPAFKYSYSVQSGPSLPTLHAIPGGTFVMGDHFSTVDPNHPSDEQLHTVSVSTLSIGKFDVTNEQYCDYLNSAFAQGLIQVTNGLVYGTSGTSIYCETRQGQTALYGITYSGISWNGSLFSVLAGDQSMPMVGVRWQGAVAYCNWLSATEGFQPCYNLTSGTCDYTQAGYRLPTEAEWEYAANGGNTNPYYMYPWGNDPNTDGSHTNTLGSENPWATFTQINQVGAVYPWSTPVGFYDGSLHQKTDFNWPGSQASYQTSSAVNGYGLYDMAGNVWQWTNDWYAAGYYQVSPASNPTGPASGDLFNGSAYHTLRGGSYAQDATDARISNRDPAFYRQPLNTTYASIGFRVILATASPVQPGTSETVAEANLQSGGGVAADGSGNVYFADCGTGTISIFSTAGQTSVFQSNLGTGANGLKFDARGNLVVCQGGSGQVVSISPLGAVTALASQYLGKPFNGPYALWIAPSGGIYFTDPVVSGSAAQPGQYVYYISPDRSTVSRVIGDLVEPTGLIGTSDGATLYVSDAGVGATYKYAVGVSGALTGKSLFVAAAATGMEIDTGGNVYMTSGSGVVVYNPAGTQVAAFVAHGQAVGLGFGGADRRTLFVTTPHSLYSIPVTSLGVTIDGAPTITSTTRSVTNPGASDAEWITSKVTDDGSVAGVTLNYTVGGSGLPTNVFTETFASAQATTWTGTGAVNAWTVTNPSGLPVAQSVGANYGPGNACGVQFKGGDSNLSDTSITTVNGINVAGTAASVQFYLKSTSGSSSEGWTFQINAGSGFTTCLSESGTAHSWQLYTYTLTSAQLSGSMKMRFQFQGNGTTDTVLLDDITVTATYGTTTTLPMYDDGAHNDGLTGDGVYGAQIPAQPAGTLVCYSVTATDNTGLSSSDPAIAPAYYSYVVGHSTPALQINEFLANPTSFSATADYPTQTVGLFTSSSSANPGYTIVDPMMGKTTYLIDITGQVVHSWTSTYAPGRSCYLLSNGNLIRAGALTNSLVNTGGGEGGIVEERDWNNNLVWSFRYSGTNGDGTAYEQHHDFCVLPNGNILMLVVEQKTYAQAIAAGFNPALFDANLAAGGAIQMDSVVEVQQSGTAGGNVAWQWHFWDHLIQSYDSSKLNYGVVASHPELLNANCGQHTIQFFNHANSIAYNAALDQVMISARNQNEIYIIDHSTTTAQAASHSGGAHGKGGDFLYRWGDPSNYGATGAETLFQQHNAQWIPSGYPGAGDILVFDNGENRPGGNYSSVDEFTPPVDTNGNYALTTGSAYGPTKLTWTWCATPPSSFYNPDVGGVQRQPNGDTLICYGVKGETWEVNSSGQVVWDYQNPCTGGTMLFQGDSLPADPHQSSGYLTTIFRCERYPLGYGAFTGRTLTPSGTLEQYRDVIELRNTGTTALSLSGMYLSSSLGSPTMWQIGSGVSIAAGGYLLFYADGQTSATTGTGRHTSFILSATGGSIGLFDTNGITEVDAVSYGAQTDNVSYGRSPNGGTTWGPEATASLGSANGLIASSFSFAGNITGTYGGAIVLGGTLTQGGLFVAGEPISFNINGTTVGTATTDLGGYATLAGVSLAGLHSGSTAAVGAVFATDGVYASCSATTGLTVMPAPLVITANNQIAIYGAAIPTLTGSICGLVNGDTAASLTIQPILATSATTGSPAGTYLINVSGAVDSDYSITYASGTLTVLSPIQVWRLECFGTTGNAGIAANTAIPSNDGIPNLLKYALGLDPMTSGTSGLPMPGIIAVGSDNYLILTYSQVIAATDIAYVVEVSGDLQTWSSGSTSTALVSATNNADGVTQRVVIRDLAPMSSAAKRFIRLKVVAP